MKDDIELTAEETKQINAMLNENAKSVEQEEVEQSVDEHYRAMKKLLKVRTKSQLIEIIWSYGMNLREMQEVAKILLEENTELKAQLLGESNE